MSESTKCPCREKIPFDAMTVPFDDGKSNYEIRIACKKCNRVFFIGRTNNLSDFFKNVNLFGLNGGTHEN